MQFKLSFPLPPQSRSHPHSYWEKLRGNLSRTLSTFMHLCTHRFCLCLCNSEQAHINSHCTAYHWARGALLPKCSHVCSQLVAGTGITEDLLSLGCLLDGGAPWAGGWDSCGCHLCPQAVSPLSVQPAWPLSSQISVNEAQKFRGVCPERKHQGACLTLINLAAEVRASFLLPSNSSGWALKPARFKGREYRLVGGATEWLHKPSHIALALT